MPKDCCFKKRCGCENAQKHVGLQNWDKFWTAVSSVNERSACCILEADFIKDTNISLRIPEGIHRHVELRLLGQNRSKMQLGLEFASGSRISLKIIGLISRGDSLNLSILTKVGTGSCFVCTNRFVLLSDTTLNIETEGIVESKAANSICKFDTKVVQLGTSTLVSARPKVDVSAVNAEVTHGFAVARVPEEALYYLQSRGVDQKTAEGLYASGFLS